MQKSSPAVLFCNECLQELCERLCSNVLCEAVNNAYTPLSERLRVRSTANNRMSD